MKHTMRFSVGGKVVDVPGDELEQFKAAAAEHGATPDEIKSYRVDDKVVSVPDSEYAQFSEMAAAKGKQPESVRTMTFANGTKRAFTMPELSRFLRSDEWRKGDDFKADREERDKAVAKRISGGATDDFSFLEEYRKGLADAGGTAIGRTAGGAASRFAKFTGLLSAAARPMGTEATLSSREFHPDKPEASAIQNARNNPGMAVGDAIDRATTILFPEERQTDSAVANAVGKAVGLGAGLAEFALTPTVALAGGHYAEGWERTFDAAKARGATDEEASSLGAMRGATDAAITTAFKNAPVHRIVGALGYKPAPAVLNALAKAGEKGVAGVSRSSVATAVGKQMLANAAISASEMGALGGLQGFIDDAIMQEAEKGEIDWSQSWKTLVATGAEQAAFGAVMGLLPTPIKVREAVKQRDAMLKETLADPLGVVAYARANPEAADALAQAWRKDGKVSRRVAREAGLPEMDEATRNGIGETIAQHNDFQANSAKARLAAEEAEIAKQPTEVKPNETGNMPDEAPAKPEKGAAGEPKAPEVAKPAEGEPPRAEAPREGGVVETGEKPPATAPKSTETQTFAEPAKPVETPSRASDAKPVPDGKGKMKKPPKPINATPVEDTKFGQTVLDGAHFLNEGYKSRQNVSTMESYRKDISDAMSKASDHDLQTVIEVAKANRGRQFSKRKNYEGKAIVSDKWQAWEDIRTLAEKELAKRSTAKPAEPPAPAPEVKTSGSTTPVPTPGTEAPKVVTKNGEVAGVKPKTGNTTKREPQDVSALNEAIKEAKTVAKSGEDKLFEVKVGTTTVKFLSNEKGIEHAEKMAKTLSTVKDWSPKYPVSKIPSAPKSLKVAKGKNLAGFDDISKDYVSKGKNARTNLAKPIVKDGMVYATDGRSIIRMSAEGAADTMNAPDVAEVYQRNRKGTPIEKFTFNPSESHVGLEQASALTSKDGTVEMWRSPTGEIMFRSREADDAWSPSSTASFVGSSLKGADFIGSFNPDYLSKSFQTLAKLGVKDAEVEWRGATSALYIKGGDAEILIMPKHSGKVDADTTVQLLGGKRRLTDAGRAAALEEEIKVEQERAKARDPEITQASLDQIAKRYRNNEAKALAKIKETDGKQDPMFSRAPEGDLPDLSTEPPKSPEAEINERLDLKRLDPKRRSDPKVLAWAKKNGRNVTNGMVTPDAVRAYDEAMTEATAKRARRWFPDMKIVAHKFGETIKRGVHVLEMSVPQAEYVRWNKVLDEYEKGAMKPNSHATVLENTPTVLKRLGAPDLPVNLSKDVIDKITGIVKTRMGEEHKVPVSELRNLQIELDNPIAVFDSRSRRDAIVVLTRIIDKQNNERAVVALHLDKVRGAINVNDIASMYGKDKHSIENWTAWGLLRYVNKQARKTSAKWFQLPSDSELRARSILTEKDFSGEELGRIVPDRSAKVNGGTEKTYLRDTSGGVLGWFDPKSKEVHLLPGADPKTVAHEIMWHGTRDYITQLAAKGDARAQKFLDMMHDVEQNAPQAIKDLVNRIYARGGKAISRDTLLNEYGAWFTMGKGGEALEKALQKAENRNWFAKAIYTVKEMVKDFLTAHGRNRVDLAAIDGMTRDEFVDFLAKEFSSGKTLGNIKGPQKPMISMKETALQKYKRRVYDQNAAVRDLERDVEKKTGKKISADDSVEAANALKYGLKEAANIETQGKMREFRKILGETGIHYEDFEYYAALKAAAGRDAKIDARNIAELTAELRSQGASAADIAAAVANYRSTNGSHIDPREAKRMLAEIDNGPDAAKFEQAYDAIRPIIDETLDIQVKAGLVDAKDAATWRKEEPNYIPFKNEYDADTGEWAGRGMLRNFTAPEHHMAKGRQSAAGDILTHIFMDHQAAKLRAIENGVRQKLAALVKANPELGKVEILDKDAVRNAEKDNPNVVVFKQGGRAYKITLEGTRGEAVANAFTQRNQLKMEWADKKFMGVSMRGFTRLSGGLATRYSPTFAVRNTTKDNIELANIVYSERGPIEGSKFMGRYIASRAQMAGTLAKYITTGKIDTTTAHGKILDRYIKAGGLIAGGTRAEAFDSIKKSLTPEAIAKEMRRGNSKTRAVAKHVLNSIGYLNEYAEMATRVGIFDAEIKAGKSDAEAALFSRRATVDFNRHGDWTPGFNLFRLFSNSTLGASARAAAALGKSKYGMGFAAALFAKGVANALVDHFANADEDERRRKTGEATGKDMSEYERRTSLWYHRSGDKVYKVAQHESPFSLLSYAGDCVGRWMCGDLDGKQVAKNLGVTTAEVAYNFLPMGSANFTAQNGRFTEDVKATLVSAVCPTFLQPIAELWANVDYAGRTIYNDPGHDNKTPRAEQGRDSTPDWAKEAAVKLNESTRKEGRRKGYVDIPPEAIQKLVEGYGKNALRDVSMAVSIGEAIIKGDFSRLDPRNKPVKRDFVRPLDGNDMRFGAARKEFEANLDYFKKTEMTEDERDDYLAKFPHIRGKRGSDLLAAIKKFRKMERGFDYKNGKAIPHEWPQEKLDKFKKDRRALQAQFLELMGDK